MVLFDLQLRVKALVLVVKTFETGLEAVDVKDLGVFLSLGAFVLSFYCFYKFLNNFEGRHFLDYARRIVDQNLKLLDRNIFQNIISLLGCKFCYIDAAGVAHAGVDQVKFIADSAVFHLLSLQMRIVHYDVLNFNRIVLLDCRDQVFRCLSLEQHLLVLLLVLLSLQGFVKFLLKRAYYFLEIRLFILLLV